MGKYADVVAKLKRTDEDSFRMQVQVARGAIVKELGADFNTSELVRLYFKLRREKEEVEEKVSQLNLRIETVTTLVIDGFERDGVSSIKLEDGSSLSNNPEPQAKVADEEKFWKWCHDDADLRRLMKLPWNTTNAMVKDLLLQAKELPPGVEAYFRDKLTPRFGKSGGTGGPESPEF